MAAPLPAPAGPIDAHRFPVGHVVRLGRRLPPVIALGAFLKNTVTVIIGDEARVAADVGHLDTPDAVRTLRRVAEAGLAALPARPIAIAHDLHPDFASSRLAEALAARLGCLARPVQHHHAHIAAVMAEHGIATPVLGLALDGFGLGDDGGAWGGELLRVDESGFTRLGHLAALAQPGGDKAARQPWRMAAAALAAMGRGDEIERRFADQPGAAMIAQMLATGRHAPPTTSCGRLFDAACGLLGVMPVARFEGEAPMALEAMVSRPRVDPGGWRLSAGVLDLRPLLEMLIDRPAADGADLFHGTLAAALAAWVEAAAGPAGLRQVALGGGCFFNRVLDRALRSELDRRGIATLRPGPIGPGDPAISLGQAYATALAGSAPLSTPCPPPPAAAE